MKKDIRDTSVEQGWKSMLAILDAEMPRKNQRRPLIWWWLLAASVAGVVLFWKYSEQSTEPVRNIAPQQEDITFPMASLVQAGKITKHAAAETIQPENREVPCSTFPLSREHTALAAMPGTLNEQETGVTRNQTALSDSTLSGESDSYVVREIPVLHSLVQITPEIVSIGGARQTVQPVHTDVIPGSVPCQQKGRAGIVIGAIASHSLTGASAGFVYTRHIGRRIAARGGLSMSVFSTDQGTQPVLMIPDQDYLGATNYSFESKDQFGNAVQTQDVFTQTGQIVEVPVKGWIAAELTAMIQYKLTRKLWLQTGVVGSLTAKSIISPLNYTGNVVLQPDKGALNSLASLAGPVVRKFTQSWTTGLAWCVGKHVEWGLNVRVPLNSDIKYRKLANSAMSTSNSGFDNESTNLFTGCGASALLTASAIWNF